MQSTIHIQLSEQFGPIATWDLTRFMAALINLILVVASISAFFMIITGGLRFILAAGDKDKSSAAIRSITGAIIGLVITYSVFAFVTLLSEFFGVPLLNYTIISV